MGVAVWTTLVLVTVSGPCRAAVSGTDFESLLPGPYPFGSPGMIELMEGHPNTVRVATAADIPAAYRVVANAEWMRSGHFLAVDCRQQEVSTVLRVRYCCCPTGQACVLHYDTLELSGSLMYPRSHAGRSRETAGDECLCNAPTHERQIEVKPGSYAMLDHFWTHASDKEHCQLHRHYGGEFAGPDFNSFPLGPFSFENWRGVRLIHGDENHVRVSTRKEEYAGRIGWGRGRCLCVEAPDDGETTISVLVRLEDYPSASCRVRIPCVADGGRGGIEFELDADGEILSPGRTVDPDTLTISLMCQFEVADGREHSVTMRLRSGASLCLGQPYVELHGPSVSSEYLVMKAAADSALARRDAESLLREALKLFGGSRDERRWGSVLALATFGRDTDMWRDLGWRSRTVNGIASRDRTFCLLRTAGAGEWGQSGDATICLIGPGGLYWVRPYEAFWSLNVTRHGLAVLARPTEVGFAIDLVDSLGVLCGTANWERPSRSWPTNWERITLGPDESSFLVTVRGAPDSLRTALHAVDLTGRPLWSADLGRCSATPTIECSPDGDFILAYEYPYGLASRFVVLHSHGAIVSEYDMSHAFRPDPDHMIFVENGLRRLDMRSPAESVIIPPGSLYPYLLEADRRTHFGALRALFNTARTLFEVDPELLAIVERMRADSTYAMAIHNLDAWLEYEEKLPDGGEDD